MSIPLRNLAVLVVVATATAVSQSFGRFTYAVLYTDVRDGFQLSNTLAGSLGSINLVAYLLGSLIVSVVVGRTGLSTMVRWSLALVTIGLGVLAWSPTSSVVALGLMITGFAAAGVWIAAPALATAELGERHRGVAIGIAICGVGLGMVAASALDAALDWRAVYGFEAVVGAVVTVLMLMVARRNPPSAIEAAGLGAIRGVPGWRPLLLAYGGFAAGMSLVVTFLVALLEDDAGFHPARASLAFSLLGFGSVLGGPIFGLLADRAGRRFALCAAFLTMAGSSLVIVTGLSPWVAVAAFVFGTSFTGVPVAVTVVISDHVRGARFGAAYGVATIVFGLGLAVGPQLGGIIADVTGSFRPVFAIAIGCALLGAALSFVAIGRGEAEK